MNFCQYSAITRQSSVIVSQSTGCPCPKRIERRHDGPGQGLHGQHNRWAPSTSPHPLGCTKLTILRTLRWNSHLVLSNSKGSPSVLPLVGLPKAHDGTPRPPTPAGSLVDTYVAGWETKPADPDSVGVRWVDGSTGTGGKNLPDGLGGSGVYLWN